MDKPELLAPAGNFEKLKWAVAYGADAVYFGLEIGSLRNFAGNFTLEDAQEGLRYLHDRGKKGYVTLNIYPFSEEYDQLIKTAESLSDIGADAFIVADLGLLAELKKRNLKPALHISTQANTTSWQTIQAYKELGASRVNLARELSLDQIRQIQEYVRGQIQTEVFIHGAVCFSYSGRCAISDYMTGYRANRGECKHPCRYQYYVVEEKRPGKYYPVFEDNRGIYLFNNKDLALFEFLPQLTKYGVNSFKIEGRMKSIHYIATVVSFYRQLLDGTAFTKEQALDWLNRVPNRGFTAGFTKGSFEPDDYQWDHSVSQGSHRFVADVYKSGPDSCEIQVRNTIHAGDELEILTPDGKLDKILMDTPLETIEGEFLETAQSNRFLILKTSLSEYTILRKKLTKIED